MCRLRHAIVAATVFIGACLSATPAKAAPLPVTANFSPPAVALNVDGGGAGRLEVFVVGQDGFAYHAWNTTPGVWTSWSQWERLPGRTLIGGLAAVRRSDGTLEVFGRDVNNAVVHNRRHCLFGNTWCGWEAVAGGSTFGSPAVVTNRSGAPELFVHGTDGRLYTTTTTGEGYSDWAAWTRVQSTMFVQGSPSAVKMADGNPQVFIEGKDWEVYQSSRGPTGYPALTRVGDSLRQARGGRPGAALYTSAGRRLAAVMTPTPQGAWTSRQVPTSTGGLAFEPWLPTGGTPRVEELAAAPAGDGKAVMYARSTDDTYQRQRIGGGSIGVWERIGGGVFSGPPAVFAVGQTHFVFGRGLDGQIWFTFDTGGVQQHWEPWRPM